MERASVSPRWFALAVHALALLARSPTGYSSASIASSVNTHAVFLRRVVARLVWAGLVDAREGREGGYRLARPAAQITLADVYRVMRAAGPILPNPATPNPRCEVGAGMRAALDEVAGVAEEQLLRELERHTIAAIADRAVALGRAAEGGKETRPDSEPGERGAAPRSGS